MLLWYQRTCAVCLKSVCPILSIMFHMCMYYYNYVGDTKVSVFD